MNQPGSGAAEAVREAPSDDEGEAIPPIMQMALAFLVRVGGVPLLRDVSRLFATTCEERIVSLRKAIPLDDRREIARLAHALKGSAAQVGAEALRRSATALEQHSASGSRDVLAGIVDEIATASQLASQRLNAFLRAAGEAL